MPITAGMIAAGASILGAGGGIIGDVLGYQMSKRNLKFEQDKLAYDKALQREIFAREDSAVQRRVADLKAAGLSPILAAGQGASSGPVVQTKAPSFDMPNLKSPELIMQMAQLKRELDMSEEQKKLIRQQVVNAESQNKNIIVDTAKKSKEYETEKYELELAQRSGTSTKASGFPKLVKDGSGIITRTYLNPDGTKKAPSEIPWYLWKNEDIARYIRDKKSNKGGKKK